jgi:hypothetical protein
MKMIANQSPPAFETEKDPVIRIAGFMNNRAGYRA